MILGFILRRSYGQRLISRKTVVGVSIFIGLFLVSSFVSLFIGPSCAREGGIVYDYRKSCCTGLESQPSHTRYISIGEECYSFTNGGDTTLNYWCYSCGNGKCKYPENKCLCPQDCRNKPSDYNTTEEFCKSHDFEMYCGSGTWVSMDECEICPNYKRPF